MEENRCYRCYLVTGPNSICNNCGAINSKIKRSFFDYIGAADSLKGYQKSYKLVLLKFIFQELDARGAAAVDTVINDIRCYYYGRKVQGLLTDRNVDSRIGNIDKSTDQDIFAVMKSNPYAVINAKEYLNLEVINSTYCFVLLSELHKTFDEIDFIELRELLDMKLQYYYKCIDNYNVIENEKANYGIEASDESNIDSSESEGIVSVQFKSMDYNKNFAKEKIATTDSMEHTGRSYDLILSPELEEISITRITSNRRALNSLRHSGIGTVGEFISAFQQNQLYNIRNVGKLTLREFDTMYRSIQLGLWKTTDGIEKRLVISGEKAVFLINEVFQENTFHLFREYCMEHEVNTLGDLSDFDFNSLLNNTGFGHGKVEKVFNRYCEVASGCWFSESASLKDIVDSEDISSARPFGYIHETNRSLSIRVLTNLGITVRLVRLMLDMGYKDLLSLAEAHEYILIQKIGSRDYTTLSNKLQDLELPLGQFTEKVFEQYKSTSEYQIYEKRANGQTLQQVADSCGLTRERIRQICEKFEKQVILLCREMASSVMNEKGVSYASKSEILDTLESTSFDNVIIFALKNCNDLEYLDFAEVFVVSQMQCMEESLMQFASEFVGEGINLFEKLDELDTLLRDNDFDFIDFASFINLLVKYNYYFYGDYVVYGKRTYAYLCEKLIAKNFSDGFKLNDSSHIQELRSLAAKTFPGLELPPNDHAFSSRLSSYLILRDRGTYISPSTFTLEAEILSPIIEFIDGNPHNELFYSEIFSELEGYLLMMTPIDNYNYLHGALMYLFPDMYEYSSRDTLKKLFGGIKKTLPERIQDILIQAEKPLPRNQIIEAIPGISDAMVLNAVIGSRELFQWEYNCYNCAQNLNLDLEEKDRLESILIKILSEHSGYCSDNMMYDKIMPIPELQSLCIRNRIGNSTNLFYAMSYWFKGKYQFNRPHIANIGTFSDLSAKEIALKLLDANEKISLKAFFELSKNLKWSDVTASAVFATIDEEYIRVSKDQYVSKSSFALAEEQLEFVEAIITNQINVRGKWYLPLSVFNDCDELCLQYAVNEFFVASVCQQYDLGFKIIRPNAKDRRYEKGVLVYQDVDVNDFAQLINQILNEQQLLPLTENQLLSFMILQGLAIKAIPKEILEAKQLKFINGMVY